MPRIDESPCAALISPQATFTGCTAYMSLDLDCQVSILCTSSNHCAEYITMPRIDESLYAALISPQATFTRRTAHVTGLGLSIYYTVHFFKSLCGIYNHAAYGRQPKRGTLKTANNIYSVHSKYIMGKSKTESLVKDRFRPVLGGYCSYHNNTRLRLHNPQI